LQERKMKGKERGEEVSLKRLNHRHCKEVMKTVNVHRSKKAWIGKEVLQPVKLKLYIST